MIFEEALSELRKGKKIRHPHFDKDEYLCGCYVGFIDHYDDDGKLVTESLEEKKARGMSIVKMKGKVQHPDMLPRLPFREYIDLIEKYSFLRDKITYPTINILLLMSDKWEVFE